MKKYLKRIPRRAGTLSLLTMAMLVLLVWPACRPKMKIPGVLYVLSQTNIYAISQDSVGTVLTDVAAAALSPDRKFLLYSTNDQTFLRELATEKDKPVLAESGRTLGWNADGSRFFIFVGGQANRLYSGTADGTVTRIFQGLKSKPRAEDQAEGSAPAEPFSGELSGVVFLTTNTLVFSAFDGPPPRQPDFGNMCANKGFLVRLDAIPPKIEAVDFPGKERWKFVDVAEDKDLILLSVDKNPENVNLFQCTAVIAPHFEEWDKISLQNEIPQNITRWENGSWGVTGELALFFTPKTNLLFGVALETTEKGPHEYMTMIDPETGQTERGPDVEAGQIVNRPLLDAGEQFAAFLYSQGTEEHLTVVDLAASTRSVVWKIKAPKGYTFDVKRDRLLAWVE